MRTPLGQWLYMTTSPRARSTPLCRLTGSWGLAAPHDRQLEHPAMLVTYRCARIRAGLHLAKAEAQVDREYPVAN